MTRLPPIPRMTVTLTTRPAVPTCNEGSSILHYIYIPIYEPNEQKEKRRRKTPPEPRAYTTTTTIATNSRISGCSLTLEDGIHLRGKRAETARLPAATPQKRTGPARG
ncbi:hypothetical protein O6U65_0835 [Saccharomyces cerevisiae synthetic construct]|uniref:Putative uncharacterized protein YER088C-A n=1 Tax=Saccharomyces cerevisiae (strain ATCC 204508 / S288c) TaxID=559292 RepID=YE88A_YEAST|nr:RecName: Full=Putative uncharacterized protein YER088C-A [Saccharomyces cerevisiae S288C]AHX39279.1 hypothetical protein YER088C-A [Saccharomyces cerevisiae]WNV72520.1 hypothetical protein O6U65_0835 [Saccharomyces cerevisiae synthetic construct]